MRLDLVKEGGGYRTANAFVPVGFPRALKDGFTFGKAALRIKAEPSVGGSGGAALPYGENGVLYPDAGRDTDFLMHSALQGAEAAWQLRSPSSPERFALEFALPPGAQLERAGDEVRVVRGGAVLARVSPPAAWDAQGRELPVALGVRGERIELALAHRGREVAYPILLDPQITEDWTWCCALGEAPAGLEQWKFVTTNPDKFEGRFDCQVLAGGCRGWGLFVYAEPNWYNAGDYGHWEYWVPRYPDTTAFVGHLTNSTIGAAFRDVYHSRHGDPFSDTRAYTGIFSPSTGWWTARWYSDNEFNGDDVPLTPGSVLGGTASAEQTGKAAIVGLWMRTAKQRGKYSSVMASGAVIYLDDPEPPQVTPFPGPTAPTGWVKEATFTLNLKGYDPGLGLARVFLTEPTGAPPTPGDGAAACTGHRAAPCPKYLEANYALDTATMLEGVNTYYANAWDVRAPDQHNSGSPQQPITYKVDRSRPWVVLSGSLYDARGQTLSASSYSLTATGEDWGSKTPSGRADCSDGSNAASRSGIKRLTIHVDAGIEYDSFDKPAGTCTFTAPPFTFSPADYGPGEHIVRVTATDHVDLVHTESFTVRVLLGAPRNETRPTIVGTAKKGHTLTASDGVWSGDAPMTTSYQWQRCDATSRCSDIPGATAGTYTPYFGDVRWSLRVVVTKRNDSGTTTATSDVTARVVGAPPDNDTGGEYEESPDPTDGYTPVDSTCIPDSSIPGGEDCADDGDRAPYASAAQESSATSIEHRGYGIADDSTTSDSELLFGGPFTEGSDCPVDLREPTDFKSESDQDFRDLKLLKTRLIVPYDIMRAEFDCEAPTEYETRLREVIDWLEGARTNGKSVIVSFERAIDLESTPTTDEGKDTLPSIGNYSYWIHRFDDRFPWITDYTAWNEPNAARQPTERDPIRAGKYWITLRGMCLEGEGTPSARDCRAIAGDFLDTHFRDSAGGGARFSEWFDDYKQGLGERNPAIWSIHAYRTGRVGGDKRRAEEAGQTYSGPDPAKTMSDFMRWTGALKVRCAGSPTNLCEPRIWLTEQGGLVYRGDPDGSPREYGSKPGETNYSADLTHANRMLDYLLSSLRGDLGSVAARITRFYVYEWHGSETHDTGLVELREPSQNRAMYTTFRAKVTSAAGYPPY